eukprot:GEMP01032746.1.p1 GENE.GEMP01032746.1~~GEMP01032746.1.p1  ORF type:complete len:270 (+),score=39.12 GEMP01032746.1:163-972(+)
MGGKVVLLAAGIFAATAQTQLTHTCSRSIAREVRRKVDDDFVKGPLRVHGISDYVLPDNCPFKEQNDIWHYHESQKRRKRVNGQLTWECSICGKKFKSEHYLDVHMEAKHMNEATGNVCLANYCVVFDLCEDSRGLKRNKFDACIDEVQQLAHTLCDEAVALCFPIESRAKLVNIDLRRNYCAMMNCQIRREHKEQHHASLVSTFPLIIGILFIIVVIFLLVLCCVDHSEEIVHALVNSRIASTGFLRNFIRTRNRVQTAVGVKRIREI